MPMIEMSPQQALNTIWAYFVQHKGPLGIEELEDAPTQTHARLRSCVYRGSEGQRCPVGLLIPDELYRPEFEARAVGNGGPVDALFPAETVWFLSQVQSVHDRAVTNEPSLDAARSHFESGLRRIAAVSDLKIPC